MSSLVKDRMFNAKLLTTVYRQYWPVPGWNDVVSNDQDDRYKPEVPQMRRGSATAYPPSSQRTKRKALKQTEIGDKQYQSTNGTSFSKLDKETLHRLGWAQRNHDTPEPNPRTSEKKQDVPSCKLTKAEFRRLSDQVREVSMEFSRRFRPASSLQASYYIEGKPVRYPPGRNSTHVYRSQLAASLRVFQLKTREPLDVEKCVKSPVLPCRPASPHPETRNGLRRSGCPSAKGKRSTRLVRPRSVPARAYRILETDLTLDPQPGHFDSLDPELLSHLVIEKRPKSAYGDRVPSPLSLSSSESAYEETIPRGTEQLGEDGGSTSGLESNLTEESDTSDGEAGIGSEPCLDSHRQILQMALRPEKWDAIYSPPGRNDPTRFDFDAQTVELPEYEFANPLPDYCADLDLQVISSVQNPFSILPKEPSENRGLTQVIKRLADIEKYQAETVEAEKRKKEKQKQNVTRPKLQKSPSFSGSLKDKCCSSECLQIACTGSCPCKAFPPDRCGHQGDLLLNTGYADMAYEMRMRQRQTPSEIKAAERRCRPRSCISCKKVHTAKYINANNVILGRPRSSNSTYSSGHGSHKPKDMRTKEASEMPNSVVKEFERLGMKANKPSYSKSQARPKGRSALSPGKSFFSQRRESLTKTGMKQILNAMAGKKLASQRVSRRPLTAE